MARVDRACDAFEAAWRAGRRPTPEEFLDDCPEPDRPALLRELVAAELELRRASGERPTPEEYARRFPGQETPIALAWPGSTDRDHDGEGTQPQTPGREDQTRPGGHPARDAGPDGRVAPGLEEPRSSAGRYGILRPHARGGLGEVFVAHDSELNRTVALKRILGRHADDPASRARFLLEAEVTGGLEHPGIVPVYGLGTAPDGRPYYAMRFIHGDSLKEAIGRFHSATAPRRDPGSRSLELRQLLRRFLDVCNAIDYAHSRGVLHRDIKPGNVIIGRHGEALVVDWGLAKATGRSGPEGPSEDRPLEPRSSGGSAETLPGSALGTPAFMSPEQAAGDLANLGTASDVYSLGATLYCLLTGRPPFEGRDIGRLLEAVRRGEFPPPRAVDPSIDPPLEAICLKAMALSPAGRYAAARALADDIERWMADEPVAAYRERWLRRALRWARRHRTGVAAGVAALAVALAGTVAVLVVQAQANRDLRAANSALDAANARERARFDLAMDAIRLFHGEVSEDLLLKEKLFDALRTKLLRGAAGFYGKLEAMLRRQADRASRAALAKAHEELGELTAKIGSKPEALAVYRKALEARRALASEPGADPKAMLEVARNQLAIGKLLEVIGSLAETRAAYEDALRLAREFKGRVPGSEDALAVEGNSLGALGWLLLRSGKPAEALSAYSEALANWRRLARARPGDARIENNLATAQDNIAEVLAQTGKTAEALAGYREALAIRQRIVAAHPDDPQYQCDLANTHSGLGLLLARIGRSDEERGAYERALAIQQRLAEAHPAVTRFRSDVAWSLNNIGAVHNETGKPTEALAAHRRALEIRRGLVAANSRDTNFLAQLAASHHNIANVLSDSGRLREALAAYAEEQGILGRLIAANPELTQFRAALASSLHSTGNRHSELGDTSAGLTAHERAVAIRRGLATASPDVTEFRADLASSLNDLASLLPRTGRIAQALVNYGEARAIWDALSKANPAVAEYRSGLEIVIANTGGLLAAAGRAVEARSALEAAYRIAEALWQSEPDDPTVRLRFAGAGVGLGHLLVRAGRDREAAVPLERALGMLHALVRDQPANPLGRSRWPWRTASSPTCARGRAGGPRPRRGSARAWRWRRRWRPRPRAIRRTGSSPRRWPRTWACSRPSRATGARACGSSAWPWRKSAAWSSRARNPTIWRPAPTPSSG
jgi:serine/threonine-protein kinase